MRLWFDVRGGSRIIGAIAISVLLLLAPASALAATPSPAGATIAASSIVGLIVPVAVGWGCGRGDQALEVLSVRPLRLYDLILATVAVGTTSLIGAGLNAATLAPAGVNAARSSLVFLGLLLGTQPLGGWRLSAITPAVYLLAVVLIGRGEDASHPAFWAWIAAPGFDPTSWRLSLVVVIIGVLAYLGGPRRAPPSPVS